MLQELFVILGNPAGHSFGLEGSLGDLAAPRGPLRGGGGGVGDQLGHLPGERRGRRGPGGVLAGFVWRRWGSPTQNSWLDHRWWLRTSPVESGRTEEQVTRS